MCAFLFVVGVYRHVGKEVVDRFAQSGECGHRAFEIFVFDGSTGAGTWAMNDMGQICFDPDGDEEGETCWTKGEETDGRVAWTNPDGETVMVDFTAA